MLTYQTIDDDMMMKSDANLSEYERRPWSTRQAIARAVKFLVELQMVWVIGRAMYYFVSTLMLLLLSFFVVVVVVVVVGNVVVVSSWM